MNSAFDIASYMYMYFSSHNHIGLHGKQKSSDSRDKTSFPTSVSGGINIVLFARILRGKGYVRVCLVTIYCHQTARDHCHALRVLRDPVIL